MKLKWVAAHEYRDCINEKGVKAHLHLKKGSVITVPKGAEDIYCKKLSDALRNNYIKKV